MKTNDPRGRRRPHRASAAVRRGRDRARPRLLEALEARELLAAEFLTGPAAGLPLDIVKEYLGRNGAAFGVSPADLDRLIVSDQYTDEGGAGTTHIYLRQGYEGLPVDGAEVGAHVTPRGEIIDITGRFVAGLQAGATGLAPEPVLGADVALVRAAAALGLTPTAPVQVVAEAGGVARASTLTAPGISTQDVPARLEYRATADGARLAWDFVIMVAEPQFQVYSATADATTGELLGAAEWVSHLDDGSTYRVFAMPGATPNYGARQLLASPADATYSPFGWHDTNGAAGAEFTETQGNNVDAFVDVNASFGNLGGVTPSRPRPNGGAGLDFDFTLDPSRQPDEYADAAVTNLFYANNIAHDLFARYGFTEAAGNFQVRNYGGGGLGADPVKAVEAFGFAASTGNRDNAFMYTPPDGTSPVMAMFLWDYSSPMRSGGLDGEVIFHEFGHGVSNRLTGGPSNANALDAIQSGGMGEGWSDYWSLLFTQGDAVPTRTSSRSIGTYVINESLGGGGIRRYPYSYDMAVNPLTLGRFNGGFPNNEVHNSGEIWTQVLWDMTVLLVEKHGYSPNLAAGYSAGGAGNQLALQLVMDGLKLQPVNPTFLQARDAILKADLTLTGGENQFEIWSAFARRGFGLSASAGADANSTTVVERTDLPIFVTMSLTAPTGLVENTPLTNVRVATFRDEANPPASAFTASVSWGDGTPAQAASIVKTSDRNYAVVVASKEFVEGGRPTLTVTLDKPGVIKVVKTAALDVATRPVLAAGTSISTDTDGNPLLEGYAFDGLVATFTDTDPDLMTPDVYTAQVQWGDDGTTSPGIITRIVGGAPNRFLVTATKALGGGTSTAIVTVTGPGGARVTADTIVTVVDSDLLAGAPRAFAPTEGRAYTGEVARFQDLDPRKPSPSNYSATIIVRHPTTGAELYRGSGVVTAGPDTTPATYIVSPRPGEMVLDASTSAYPIEVRIGNLGGKTATTTATASVADAPLVGSGFTYTVAEGTPLRNFLAQFVDTDPRSHPASRYAATIAWGDTTVEGASVRVNTDGGFLVRGEHAFRTPGRFTYTVTLNETVGGGVQAITGTVVVTPAPLDLRLVTTARPLEGMAFNDTIAAFTTTNTLAAPDDYVASINWGDGSSTLATIARDADGSFRILGGSKTYEAVGPYTVIVTLARAGQPASALTTSGRITVGDAPLTATGGTAAAVSKTDVAGLVLARFRDGDPTPALADFSATITWADGTTSAGRVAADGAGGFLVTGDHRFDRAGVQSAQVAIASRQGSTATATASIDVSARLFPLAGGLAAASAAPSSPLATADATPILAGTSEPGATVRVLATPVGGGAAIALGSTVAGSTGAWSLTAAALADGRYLLDASAVDALGAPSSATTRLASPIVVDTTGPRVQAVRIDPKRGQVVVTLADAGAGLNGAAVASGAAFRLASVDAQGKQRALRLAGASAADGPAGTTAATLRFAGLNKAGAGRYVLNIDADALTDAAGNRLDESYYIPFPSLYGQRGQDFIAAFDIKANGQASGLKQFVPPPEVEAARRHRRFLGDRLRTRGATLS